jgi:hypothetical protein
MYDGFAQNSLWIISRLAGKCPRSPNGHRYHLFADVWMQLYEEALPEIERIDLRGYPYQVRVFDKILWIVGEPNYNRNPCQLGLAAGAKAMSNASKKPGAEGAKGSRQCPDTAEAPSHPQRSDTWVDRLSC